MQIDDSMNMSFSPDPGEEELNNYRAELNSLASQITALLENTGVGIYIVQDSKFVYVNPFFEELSGYKLEGIADTCSLDLVHPDDRDAVRVKATQILKQQQCVNPYEYRLIKKSGDPMWVLERVSSIEYLGRRAVIGSFMDINERKLLEEALSHSEEKYRSILEQMQDSYSEFDLAGNYTFANESNCRELGYTMEELIGMNYRKIVPIIEATRVFAAYNEIYRTGEPKKRFEHKVVKKNGDLSYAETAISLLKDRDGNIIGFRGVSRDVTERKMLEEKLAEMATKDFLTGLPNRALLHDRFQLAVAEAHRESRMLAVMSLDLDRFKIVNDSMGHNAGDELLRGVAERLTSTLRSTDTVARIGGDEFLLLLPKIHTLDNAIGIANKIICSFQKPFAVHGNDLLASVSIGLAICPNNGEDLETLMHKSDAALYQAKNSGRNQFAIYNS
ncbi:MAG: diguanylate cyclase [Dehalococcoidia bacterium]|jgi:diguanylate cyclase (GGDEF)-like protein/PAS domain S-box-containing protein